MEYAYRLLKKYGARRACLPDDSTWVLSTAVHIDLSKEDDVRLAADMATILEESMLMYSWGGASSNNVMCAALKRPVRVIRFPDPAGRVVTIINPVLELSGDKPFTSYESCGSIPQDDGVPVTFCIPRYPQLRMKGCEIDSGDIHEVVFDYTTAKDEPYETIMRHRIACAQHEVDHLNGITLLQRSNISTKSVSSMLAAPPGLERYSSEHFQLAIEALGIPEKSHALEGHARGLPDGWVYQLPEGYVSSANNGRLAKALALLHTDI